jgi:hypothetical protein
MNNNLNLNPFLWLILVVVIILFIYGLIYVFWRYIILWIRNYEIKQNKRKPRRRRIKR